jgi:hypothetical protein
MYISNRFQFYNKKRAWKLLRRVPAPQTEKAVQQNVKRDDPGRGKVTGCSTDINRKEFEIPSRVGLLDRSGIGTKVSFLYSHSVAAVNTLPNWLLVPKVTFLPSNRANPAHAETFKILVCSNCSNPYLLRCSERSKIVKDADRCIFVQIVYLNTWNPIIHLIATELSTKAYSPPIMLLPWPSSPSASFQFLVS